MCCPFDRQAIKDLIRRGDPLFAMIHAFNRYPGGYAHASWLEGRINPGCFETLRKSRRGMRGLSRILLRQNNLHAKHCYDFSASVRRLALLPPDMLDKLTLYCGLAVHHRQLAALVERRTLTVVKHQVGEAAYRFAVQRAPLLLGATPADLQDWDGRGDFRAFASQNGVAFFLSLFHEAPPAVTLRLALKFPRKRVRGAVVRKPSQNQWLLFKRILLSEVDSRWRSLLS
jgi:hypothetical protein